MARIGLAKDPGNR